MKSKFHTIIKMGKIQKIGFLFISSLGTFMYAHLKKRKVGGKCYYIYLKKQECFLTCLRCQTGSSVCSER